jgi:hypothetical protein
MEHAMNATEHKEFVRAYLGTGGQDERFEALTKCRDVWDKDGALLQVAPLDAPDQVPFGGTRYLNWAVTR